MVHSGLRSLPWAAALLALAPAAAHGQFAPVKTIATGATGANSVVGADLDLDGDQDAVIAEYTGDQLSWVANLGAGAFGPKQTIASALDACWNLRAADLDGDGRPDVAATVYNADAVVWVENALDTTGWTLHPLEFNADQCGSLDFADADLDGDLDVFVGNYGESQVLEFVNLGGGTFSSEQVITKLVAGPWSLAAKDLDLDGRADIVTGGWSDANLYTLVNDGAGGFGPPTMFASGVSGTSSLEVHDLDGDGDMDILSAARSANVVAWYENQGSTSVFPEHFLSTGSTPFWATAADFDDDADLDVVVANSGLGEVYRHENLGAGAFGPAITIATGVSGVRYVSVFDLEGDYDPDILAAGFSSNSVGLVENLVPAKKPKVTSVSGLHCLEQGLVTIDGKNLLNVTVAVDGVPAQVIASTGTTATFRVDVDVPGGLRDLRLTNAYGATEWPDALRRFPVLAVAPAVGPGEAIPVTLDNGDAGAFYLALSGSVFQQPAIFPGWYHGLELSGVWILAGGTFSLAVPAKELVFPGVTSPSMFGVPVHLQALMTQATPGVAGFTASSMLVIQP